MSGGPGGGGWGAREGRGAVGGRRQGTQKRIQKPTCMRPGLRQACVVCPSVQGLVTVLALRVQEVLSWGREAEGWLGMGCWEAF